MDRLSITGAAYVGTEHTTDGLDVLVDVTDQDGREHSLRFDVWPRHTARVYHEPATEHSPPVDDVDIEIDLEDCPLEDYGDGFNDPIIVKLDRAGTRMVEELIYDGPVLGVLEDAARQAFEEVEW